MPDVEEGCLMCACALGGGCACEAIEALTPAVREEVQDYYVRAAAARRRRALHDEKGARVTRYDHRGRPIGNEAPERPRISQDLRPRGSQSEFYRRSRARGGPCTT